MPQKAKFSKEEIIKSAIEIIESQGIEYLTARSLGEKLGSSARPIFTTFKNMDDVLKGVNCYANDLYQKYISDGLKEALAFKGVGTSYIRFATKHPKLFQLMFMKEQKEIPDINNVLGSIEGSYQGILNSITNSYKVSEDVAKKLYLHMWIYTHGIAVLIVNKMCKFTSSEISDMLTTVCKSLIMNGVKND
ncbi:MAG TPA: TetR family transcriptional regulator [Firmicutes bacterium]|nr:TetR family transcriptional regulator [Bacillota bacterium]